MKHAFLTTACLLAAAGIAPAQNKIDVKLGLWEVTTTTDMKGMPGMPAGVDTSKMPPEARARIEAMMKARQTPQSRTMKECMTQEKLDRDLLQAQENNTCKRTQVSSTLTTRKYKVECTGKANMTGEAEFTATSREAMTGWVKLTMNSESGTPMTVNSNLTGKWLSASCGDVK